MFGPKVEAKKPNRSWGKSLTEQSHKNAVNVNKIVSRYVKSDRQFEMPDMSQFGVQPSVTLHEAMNVMVQAQQSFDQLDPKVRASFDNDPGKFLDYVSDPANKDDFPYTLEGKERPDRGTDENATPEPVVTEQNADSGNV